MVSQDDMSAADVKWSSKARFSRRLMKEPVNEDAARLSRELRQGLIERLAGSSLRKGIGDRAASRGEDSDRWPKCVGRAVR